MSLVTPDTAGPGYTNPNQSVQGYISQQLGGLNPAVAAPTQTNTATTVQTPSVAGVQQAGIEAPNDQINDSIAQTAQANALVAQEIANRSGSSTAAAPASGANTPNTPGATGAVYSGGSQYANGTSTYHPPTWGGSDGLSAARNQVLNTAASYVGDPYKLGGLSHQGIDCSGLIMAVYDQMGLGQYVNSHLAGHQAQAIPGVRTSVSNLVPGDIVAWSDGSHIAVYAGNGMIIAAAAPGEGVKYQPVWGNVYGIHIKLPGE